MFRNLIVKITMWRQKKASSENEVSIIWPSPLTGLHEMVLKVVWCAGRRQVAIEVEKAGQGARSDRQAPEIQSLA